MQKLPNFFTFIFLMVLPSLVFAQKGKIRATILDATNGEALFGVTVVIKGTSNGAITDFDGKCEISAEAGVYDIQASFVSYKTVTITGINVKAGEVNYIGEISLSEDVAELAEIVITADVIRNSESGLLTVKRKAANLLDGISSASFRKIGDSDAAAAVKRVPGVSIEGGKYVYVRGLGDRYSKTTLNNVDIPGLDPDRNSIQLDIFPTNLMDNMIVIKSSLAQLPADFTGGIVNIETKDFSDEKVFDVSIGTSFNPGMHFNPNFLVGNTGKTDFLGYDDGSRALPIEARQETIPSPLSQQAPTEVNGFLNKFNPTLGAQDQTSLMDYNLSISSANQMNIKGSNKLGYIVSATYKNSAIHYDDMQIGEFQRRIDPSERDLRYATVQSGALSERNVLVGLLGGLAYKTQNTKLKFTGLRLQNGISKAGQFNIDNDGQAVGQSGYLAYSNNLEYNQRGLTNFLLNGEHHIGQDQWEIDWRISPTFSSISDPDVRKAAFTYSQTDTTFSAGAGGNPTRIWRNLEELNLVSKVDISKKYSFKGTDAKLRFGASHVYKERDFEILSYDLQFYGAQPDFGINPNNVLKPENLYPFGTLYYSSGNNTPNPNQYNSNINNLGLYVSNEFDATEKLKAIVGLRAENYQQRHTGRDVEFASFGSGNNLDNDLVLDSFDFFPSLNLVYALNDLKNLRGSYSRTIARPSFKEMSFAQIIDPITNRIFNGGLFKYGDWDGQLKETRIDNLDLRWEMYTKSGELYSMSAFYKAFDAPIELVRIQEQQTSTEYQPRNVGNGKLVGIEIEIRKNLEFVAAPLRNFNFSGNVSIVRSSIQMTDREFNSRKQYEKEGQTVKNTRAMAGQAPWIINSGFSYENKAKGLDAGLFYNVKGPTLLIVGAGLFPDVFSKPFNSLNFNLNKTLGIEKRTSLNISVSNILNDVWEEVFTGYETNSQNFTSYSPNTSFGVGLKHSF
jgi:outer membrane receptor protein involved in Fe transport